MSARWCRGALRSTPGSTATNRRSPRPLSAASQLFNTKASARVPQRLELHRRQLPRHRPAERGHRPRQIPARGRQVAARLQDAGAARDHAPRPRTCTTARWRRLKPWSSTTTTAASNAPSRSELIKPLKLTRPGKIRSGCVHEDAHQRSSIPRRCRCFRDNTFYHLEETMTMLKTMKALKLTVAVAFVAGSTVRSPPSGRIRQKGKVFSETEVSAQEGRNAGLRERRQHRRTTCCRPRRARYSISA